MGFLRWIGIALAVLVLGLVAVAIVARSLDGPLRAFPLALLPGGPLRTGELVTGPEPDWSFARDIQEMEFQLLEPARSRITWLLVHEGKLYLASGYMNSWWGRLWKQWPHDAMKDGRAVIRIAGKRYEREAVRVTDPELFWPLIKESLRKYRLREDEPLPEPLPSLESTGVWLFEMAPRSGAPTGTGSSPGS
jgi:hypothetical protein